MGAVAAEGTVNCPGSAQLSFKCTKGRLATPAVFLFGATGPGPYAKTRWPVGCGNCCVNQKEYGVAPFNW